MGPFRYWPAPAAANLTAGDVQLFGASIVGVATSNIATGALADLAVEGTFEADKAEGFQCNPGDAALYNTSTGLLVNAAGANVVEVGVCIEEADEDADTCLIALQWSKSDAPDPSSSSS
jgi:predicted RecA/RadA family phage recombinase